MSNKSTIFTSSNNIKHTVMKKYLEISNVIITIDGYEFNDYLKIKNNPLLLSEKEYKNGYDSHFLKVKKYLFEIADSFELLNNDKLTDNEEIELFTLGDYYIMIKGNKCLGFPISYIKFYKQF